MSDGDTDDLLLRDIEAAVARARAAFAAEQWEALAMNLADIQWQALRLTEALGPRLAGGFFG